MKKIILALAIIISTMSAFAKEETVNAKVLVAFKSEFQNAKDVTWTARTNYFQATFVYNDKHLFAFYNEEGELLGLSRYLSPDDISLNLQMNLKKNYSDYWISDLFEVSKHDGTSYYITVENAESKVILKSVDSSNWVVFEKIKKV